MYRFTLALVVFVFGFVASAHGEGDPLKGAKVYRKCKACHSIGEGAKNKVGPALNGIVDRPAASLEGFKYSKALRESGIVWDETMLAKYLKKPRAAVKGTKMAFAGLKKDDQIADVIAYLRQFAADGTRVP